MDSSNSTQKKAGRPDWVPGMSSPNPAGRGRGTSDKRRKLREALEKDAPAVAEVVIAAAKAGDMQAAALILNRTCPPLKTQAEKVSFNFKPDEPIVAQCEQVLLAVAAGQMSPDNARGIIETIATVKAIQQVTDLEQRLLTLENRI